ncbi:MAG: PH domain-containing protein [Gemmataceae bacterium]
MNVSSTLSYTCPHCKTAVDVVPHAGKEIVTCPACDKPFQVTLPEAEPVPAEPHVLLAADGTEPAVVAAQTATQPVEAAHAEALNHGAPLVAEALAEKEEPVTTVHLSMLRRYPGRCFIYATAFVGGAFLGVLFYMSGYPVLALLCAAVSVFSLLKFFGWWLRTHSTRLLLTSKRCVLETGVFGTHSTEVSLPDISEVRVGQSLLTRLLGVGDLTIISNGAEKRQVVIMAVPHPKDVAELIRGQGKPKELPAMPV